ncbi:MAG: DNA primase small subunit PriS [Thermoplasmata archaeon]|nr:DNA primase small subunit PriS [Thermoplasmata archaeon]
MAKSVPLAGAALEFVAREFANYYERNPPALPPGLAEREVAMFPFARTDLMRRHLAFPREAELQRYLRAETPRHLYYSTAYYRHPEASSMNAKEWLGADLVFDLDADHLRSASELDYPAQLELVKTRFRSLLDDFLFGDFGLDPREATLVFSGNRGYHVHVRTEAVRSLSSAERRELVEYVLGVGVEPQAALAEEEGPRGELVVEVAGGPSGPRRTSRGPRRPFAHLAPADAPGWRGRTSRAVLQLLDRWEAEGAASAAVEMTRAGLEPARATRLAKELLRKGRPELIRENRSLEVFPGAASEDLLQVVLRIAAIEVQGETDAPVTTDIHRLIRWPGSLHGGSGLRVVELSREELDRFEPLRDAALAPGSKELVPVELSSAVDLPFGEERLQGKPGERLELSRPAATFLILRGEATWPAAPA